MAQLITRLGYRHGHWQVFADFVEMAAISVSNAVDWGRREKREERYLEIVKRYTADEVTKFPEMFADLTIALDEDTGDVPGRTFHDLELHNKWAGQYFSPYPLCRMIAKMPIADTADLEARITERGRKIRVRAPPETALLCLIPKRSGAIPCWWSTRLERSVYPLRPATPEQPKQAITVVNVQAW